jgi:hypothetical protein
VKIQTNDEELLRDGLAKWDDPKYFSDDRDIFEDSCDLLEIIRLKTDHADSVFSAIERAQEVVGLVETPYKQGEDMFILNEAMAAIVWHAFECGARTASGETRMPSESMESYMERITPIRYA